MNDDALLFDLGPLTCHCTTHVLDELYKALADPPDPEDTSLWEPHHDPWMRNHIETVTRRGQTLLETAQNALFSPLDAAYPLRKAVPWERWDAPEFERVRALLEAIPPAQRTLEDWMLAADWIMQKYLGEHTISTEAEYIAVRSHLIGKIQAGMDIMDLHPTLTHIERIVALLPASMSHLPPALITEREAHILSFAVAETANNITAVSTALRTRIKRTLIDGIQQMTLGTREGTWNRLQQRLLDDFGTANRDWRRIAITETGNATNTGFITSLAPGTQVRRKEAYKGACPYCNSIRDRVLTVVPDDQENKDWDNEVWPGKNNLGRSASPRKRVGNVLVDREPDEMWSIPAGLVHPHCFISPKIPIYTSEGWKPIRNIQVGDQVLTHKGRFKTVNWVLNAPKYTGDTIRLTVSFHGKNAVHLPLMTPEHPVLTENGWMAVRDLTIGDTIACLAKICPTCGDEFINSKHPNVLYCSVRCAPRTGVNQFSTDDQTLHAKAVQQTADSNRLRMRKLTLEQRRQLTEKGRSVMKDRGYDHLQCTESRHKGQKNAALKNYQPSDAEKRIAEHLKQLGQHAELQYRIPQQAQDSLCRHRYWFLDIALPEAKIAVEIDGEYWHPRSRDQERDEDIIQQGWTVRRYDSTDAKQRPERIADELCRMAMNHQNEYQFSAVTITAISRHQAYQARLYNFGVDEDESYIIRGGIVVHNCRGSWAIVGGGDTGVDPDVANYIHNMMKVAL